LDLFVIHLILLVRIQILETMHYQFLLNFKQLIIHHEHY
jgi:hypothetical protein